MGSVTPNWNGGTTNCSTCHGYPPSVGTNHLDGNRTGYTNNDTTFFAAHGQCSRCHGVAGDTSYPTPPTGFGTPVNLTPTGDAYVIGTMHGDGSVQMNGAGGANSPYTENSGYNQATWACDSAGCHGGAEPDGGLDLSRVVETGPAAIDLRAWKAVRSRVALHEMPPASAKSPPPSLPDRAAITRFVDRRVKEAAASRPARPPSA